MAEDELELKTDQAVEDLQKLEVREFDINPESGHVAVVSRNFMDIERKELTEELADTQAAQDLLVEQEMTATKARKEGDLRIAALKSELEGFDEIAHWASIDTGAEGNGGKDTPGAEESQSSVELD